MIFLILMCLLNSRYKFTNLMCFYSWWGYQNSRTKRCGQFLGGCSRSHLIWWFSSDVFIQPLLHPGSQGLWMVPQWAVFSYKLRYIAGFGLVEMTIPTNPKPTIYRNLYEKTGAALDTCACWWGRCWCLHFRHLTRLFLKTIVFPGWADIYPVPHKNPSVLWQ